MQETGCVYVRASYAISSSTQLVTRLSFMTLPFPFSYNKAAEDFNTKEEWDDYLENIEDISKWELHMLAPMPHPHARHDNLTLHATLLCMQSGICQTM